jgi:hypothetical protein|tara:strand:+ start:1348 stop:1764 length:417 start_codon:yes stop_codon:yes gene_type:complete
MKESKYCEHCKAKMVEYKHGFSKPLATGLWRLYKAGGTVNLKDLNLTRNQWDNFQKLRYWDLVAPAYRETGLRMSGCWYITPVGIEFIENGTAIKKSVWTYRGETVRFAGDACFFNDMHDVEYELVDSYAANAVAHTL